MTTKVFVGNLAFQTTDQQLEDHFKTIGPIKSGVIITRGRRSLGYGFVEYENALDAAKAVEQLNQTQFINRSVKVELVRDPPPPRVKGTSPNDTAGSVAQNEGGGEEGGEGEDAGAARRRPNQRRKPNRRRQQRPPLGGEQGGQPNQIQGGGGGGSNVMSTPPSTSQTQTYSQNNAVDDEFGGPPPRRQPNRSNYRTNVAYRRNFNNNNNAGYNNNNNNNYNNNNYNNNYNNNNYNNNYNNNSNNNNYNANYNNYNNRRRNNNNYQQNEGTQDDNYNAPLPLPRVQSKTAVFVANLPFSMRDDGLADIFKEFKVKSAHVVVTRTKRSRGYGFVEFESEPDQLKAVEKKNNWAVKVKPDSDEVRNISVTISHSTGAVQQTSPGPVVEAK